MISIIVLIYNRPALTEQTLRTLFESLPNTPPYEVILVDNQSDLPTKNIINRFEARAHILTLPKNVGVGRGKNLGVAAASGSHFYLSDNDMYFTPGWLQQVLRAETLFPKAKIIGAFRHPFHQITRLHHRDGTAFEQSDQQVGSSWFLSRKSWEQFGPLNEGLPTGADDALMCQRITEAGLWVGAVAPNLVFHCGATSSDGTYSPGGESWSQDPLYYGRLPKNALIQ